MKRLDPIAMLDAIDRASRDAREAIADESEGLLASAVLRLLANALRLARLVGTW